MMEATREYHGTYIGTGLLHKPTYSGIKLSSMVTMFYTTQKMKPSLSLFNKKGKK